MQPDATHEDKTRTELIAEISELRRQLANAARTGKADLEAVIRDSADGILVVDPQGVVLFTNTAAERILKRKKSDLLGSQLGVPVTEEGRVEISILTPSAEEVPVEFWSARTQWAGRPAIRISLRDLTEQKASLEALKKSEELLNETGEMARVGGWEIDLKTNRVNFTRTTRQIHEVPENYVPSLEEAINFYPPEVQPKISEAVRRALEEGIPYDLEVPLKPDEMPTLIAEIDQRRAKPIGESGVPASNTKKAEEGGQL